jgi:hypothetical protein
LVSRWFIVLCRHEPPHVAARRFPSQALRTQPRVTDEGRQSQPHYPSTLATDIDTPVRGQKVGNGNDHAGRVDQQPKP